MLIRNAKAPDGDALYELVCSLGTNAPEKRIFDKLYSGIIAESHRRVILAFDSSEQLVGYADIELRFTLAACSLVAQLNEFYVVPAKRSTGVGTAMLIELCTQMKSVGAGEIHAAVSRVDLKSQSFLERHGFLKSKHYFTYITEK